MRVLVLAENYTTLDGLVSMHYIHSRNIHYLSKKIDVSVISFKARDNYVIDGINVYTKDYYERNLINKEFDILLSHAPNIKNHLKFINKYRDNFKKIFFYFHGHEVLRRSQIYPKPYSFDKSRSIVKNIAIEIYDFIKLIIWRKQFKRLAKKSEFIFVSNWMYDMFLKFVKIDPEIINNKKHIIYNCVGHVFEELTYCEKTEKEYDFITIRHNLDGSKYGIDIVTEIANNNPEYKFCVVGKGEFYKHIKKPKNLEWIDKNLNHQELVKYLNRSKCALLPTRADSQGVIASEIATFGIPLITSDLEVCKEVFEGFKNVGFIHNDNVNIDIKSVYTKLKPEKNDRFFASNTIDKEVDLFNMLKG